MKKQIKRSDVSELGHAEKTILIEMQQEQILLLKEQIKRLEMKLKHLDGRLNKNSKNSHKPPSSDPKKPKKTKSQKKKSDKNPGGQPGHKGSTLEMHAKPDEVIRYDVSQCAHCGHNLKKVSSQVESRQVFDIPEPKMVVTEHQVESKDCRCCGYTTTACFPQGITHKTQYGVRAKSLLVYMTQYQFLPYDRASEFFEAIYGQKISPGTIVNAVNQLGHRLETLDGDIKTFLAKAKVAHADETSMSMNGVKHWLHTVGTNQLTHFALHPKRGRQATSEIGILPEFKGILVHDHWKSYFIYEEITHALCNAHHIRELCFLHDVHQMKWAKNMSSLLLDIKHHKETWLDKGHHKFSSRLLKQYDAKYDDILTQARREQARRGTRDSHNMIKRLTSYKASVLLFMNEFTVPFTNNLSEQDLRMQKVKQKISGCFRNIVMGNHFCKIRSLVVSSKKNNKNPFLMLQTAFEKMITLEEITAT